MMLCLCLLLSSCGKKTLEVYGVGYQSVNTKTPQEAEIKEIPAGARIMLSYAISQNGELGVFVKNLTDEILVVDQEMSFFINTDGLSTSYYDPNVYTTSQTDFNATTTGSSFNLGALASAIGIGGPIGSLLHGTSLSSSSTYGTSTSNSVSITGQKRVSIGPRGTVMLNRRFRISQIGKDKWLTNKTLSNYTYDDSPIRFSVCIYFSSDEGKNFEKKITDFYVSSFAYVPKTKGVDINNGLREIMTFNPSLLNQPWSLIYFPNNIEVDSEDDLFMPISSSQVYDYYINGMLFDFQ